jgi:hypothetical protein
MSKPTRTDCHRPGAIIPADYEPRIAFSLPRMIHGFPCPSIGLNCVNDFREILTDAEGRFLGWGKPGTHDGSGCCCVEELKRVHAPALRCIPGRCDVCGACYKEGQAFLHTPTKTLVLMGHDCADKYELMHDASATEIAHERHARALAIHIERARKEGARADFLAQHAGLAEAFELRAEPRPGGGNEDWKRGVLFDMHHKFVLLTSLSDKQVAFALKLANEIRNPAPKRTEETWLDVPKFAARAEVSGLVLATKITEGFGPRGEGGQMKMLVAAEAEGGRFKVWSTVPVSATDGRTLRDLKGMRIRIRATIRSSGSRAGLPS